MFELVLRVGDRYEVIGRFNNRAHALDVKNEAMEIQQIDDSVAGRIEIWDTREYIEPDIDDVYRDMQTAVHGEWRYESIEDFKWDN